MSAPRILAAALFCISTMALLGGCETTTSGGAVGGDRKQLLLVSSQQLDQMAAQSYAKLKSDAAAQGTLNQDHALLQRVNAIASSGGGLWPSCRWSPCSCSLSNTVNTSTTTLQLVRPLPLWPDLV